MAETGDTVLTVVIVLLILLGVCLLLFAGVAAYALILMKQRPPLTLYEARTKQADYLPLSAVPARQTELLVELEDSDFYTHRGVNLFEIRSAVQLNLGAKKIVYGGSTITMQLAKNLYFRFTHNYLRKAAEILIALALERKLGKERILDFYINIIYFGNGVYGFSDAVRFYFGKQVSALTLNQMFLLACIPPIPTRGNPIQYPEVFERIRNRRLNYIRRKKEPLISQAEAAEIFAHDSSCLDPELRKPDDFTRNYPQTIPLINERFGRFACSDGAPLHHYFGTKTSSRSV